MSCTCLDPAALAPAGPLALTPEVALDPNNDKGWAGLYLTFRDDDARSFGILLTDAWARGATPVGPFTVQRPAGAKLLAVAWSKAGELRAGATVTPPTLWRATDPKVVGQPLRFTLQARVWGVANASINPAGPSPYAALCPYITNFAYPSPCATCDPAKPLTCIDFDPSDPRQDLEAVGAVFAAAVALRVLGLI